MNRSGEKKIYLEMSRGARKEGEGVKNLDDLPGGTQWYGCSPDAPVK